MQSSTTRRLTTATQMAVEMHLNKNWTVYEELKSCWWLTADTLPAPLQANQYCYYQTIRVKVNKPLIYLFFYSIPFFIFSPNNLLLLSCSSSVSPFLLPYVSPLFLDQQEQHYEHTHKTRSHPHKHAIYEPQVGTHSQVLYCTLYSALYVLYLCIVFLALSCYLVYLSCSWRKKVGSVKSGGGLLYQIAL